MWMYGRIAARNLVQARRRTLMLGGALALVTLLLVLLQSMSRGLTENMVRAATTLSTGHVNVAGFYKASLTDAMPLVLDAPKVRQVVEEVVPEQVYVLTRDRGWAKVVSDTGSLFAGITGIDPAQETRLASALTLAPESAYREGGSVERKGDLRQLGQPGTVVMFASQAKKLGVQVGDSVTLTAESMKGANNSAEATVVAVCEDIGLLSTWTMFASRQTGLQLYQLKPDTTGAVQIYLRDIGQADAVMKRLREAFATRGWKIMDHDAQPFFMKFESVSGEDWTGQKLDITTWEDEVSFLAKIVAAFDAVSFLLVSILVIIIGVGIMNTMWISVRERTGEIGTLRAIGMMRSRVLAMFLAEALILGLCATSVGAVLGLIASLGIDAAHIHVTSDAVRTIVLSDTVHLSISLPRAVGSVLAFTLVTCLSALWPASSAARLRPVVAIQSA